MTKFIAIILWPYVYLLDVLSFLLGFQTFKGARDTSNKLFKRIMARKTKLFERGGNINSPVDSD